MEREFIPYEQAFEIRQLGFKEECLGLWQNLKSGKYLVVDDEYDRKYDIPVLGADIGALLYQQASRWFREKHKLLSVVEVTIDSKWYFSIYNLNAKRNYEIECEVLYYDNNEEAELACLKKLIEIVKNK